MRPQPRSAVRTEVYQDIRQTREREREREGRSAQSAAVVGAESSYHRWFICKFSLLSADYKVTHDMIRYQHGNITTVGQAAGWLDQAKQKWNHLNDNLVIWTDLIVTPPALFHPVKIVSNVKFDCKIFFHYFVRKHLPADVLGRGGEHELKTVLSTIFLC